MSDTKSPAGYTRKAFAKDNGKGESVAEWTLTPVKNGDPVQIVAQPIYTVPVIFVPGIMGSNLKVTQDIKEEDLKKDQAVWLMDGMIGAAKAWSTKSSKQRQLRLNPLTTDVFDLGDVPDEVPTIGDAEAIRTQRYWGEVAAMSYQSFLVWLERTLNEKGRINQWRAELGQRPYASELFKGLAFEALEEAHVGHAANIRFPVYACGYNWLQSNFDSAKRLKARIEKVIEANNSKSFTCHKVILVTHSMGGLVARACSELLGMQGKIAGVLHGVMPATGAAVAYKRVRTGTEGLAGPVIGGDAAKVTAVFANSPGALQLLPSKDYGTGWLKLGSGEGKAFKESMSLPLADPYEEIYKKKGPWWALVREELINPAKVKDHKGWGVYLTNIGEAQSFHHKLSGKYHPNTVAFYGDGNDAGNGMTWGTVRWEMRSAVHLQPVVPGASQTRSIPRPPVLVPAAAMGSLQVQSDSGAGQIVTKLVPGHVAEFVISGKDSAGDGTVPEVSGKAPAVSGAKLVYHLNLDAEGHEGAYRVPMAQQVTLHAILRMAKDVPVVI